MDEEATGTAPPLHVWAVTAALLCLLLMAFAAAFLIVDDPFQWLLVSLEPLPIA